MDGFILSGFPVPSLWRKTFLNEKTPIVAIGEDPACGLPTVNINNGDLSGELTAYLIEKVGRRRFVFLSGGPRSYVGNERKKGFLKALASHRLTPVYSSDCDFSEDKAFEWMEIERARKGKEMPFDAVVCANDSMAIGAMRSFLLSGITIPRDVSVAGADGLREFRYFNPSLTTYSLMPHEQGTESFHLLRQIVEGKARSKHILIRSKIEMKGST